MTQKSWITVSNVEKDASYHYNTISSYILYYFLNSTNKKRRNVSKNTREE